MEQNEKARYKKWFPFTTYDLDELNNRDIVFCFHHAGGSASVYRKWTLKKEKINFACVELPGKGTRRKERFIENFEELVGPLVESIINVADDRNILFFGHSMGAAMAFYAAAYMVQNYGREPRKIVVAGRQAPNSSEMIRVAGRNISKVSQRAKELFASDKWFQIKESSSNEWKDFIKGCRLVLCSAELGNETVECINRIAGELDCPIVYLGINLPKQEAEGKFIYGAGSIPGLSGIIPQYLAQDFDSVASIDFYYGAKGTFTYNAAKDYMDGVFNNSNRSMVMWKYGAYHAAWCWEEHFIPFFYAHGYNVYAMSFRNHGNSERIENVDQIVVKDMVEDLIKTIDIIDGKIILIAHSLGCRIAQMCLEEIYSSIQSVVLITPMPVRNNFLQLLQMSKKQRKNNLEYILFSERLDSEQKEYYMSLLDKESKKVEYAMMKRQKKFSIYVRKIPTLVIGSYNDQCVILQAVKDNAKIHTAELKIVDSVCHDMMLDPDWRNIADLIFKFIEKTIDKKSGDNYNDNYVSTQAHQGGE